MAFDWAGLKAHLIGEIRAAVAAFREQRSDPIYGVAVYGFYSDGRTIGWPLIGVAGDDRSRPATRMCVGTPTIGISRAISRMPPMAGASCSAISPPVVMTIISTGSMTGFCAPSSPPAKAARKQLVADGEIPKSALVIAADEGEELISECVTLAQLATHFPHLDAERTEKDRVASLPVAEAIVALLDAMEFEDRPLDWQSAPPLLYSIAIDHADDVLDELLFRLTAQPGPAFEWRHLWLRAILDIGASRPDVVAALMGILLDANDGEAERRWAGAALCALGHMDLVVEHFADLPPDIHDLFAAPYRYPHAELPVDFAPLDRVLDAHPEVEGAVDRTIGVNHEVRDIDVEPLLVGLGSRWRVIRWYAMVSLAYASMSPDQRRRFDTALDSLERDPDTSLAAAVPDYRNVRD